MSIECPALVVSPTSSASVLVQLGAAVATPIRSGCAWPANRGIWLSVQRLRSGLANADGTLANGTAEWFPLGYARAWQGTHRTVEFGGVRCAAGCWLRVCSHAALPTTQGSNASHAPPALVVCSGPSSLVTTPVRPLGEPPPSNTNFLYATPS